MAKSEYDKQKKVAKSEYKGTIRKIRKFVKVIREINAKIGKLANGGTSRVKNCKLLKKIKIFFS